MEGIEPIIETPELAVVDNASKRQQTKTLQALLLSCLVIVVVLAVGLAMVAIKQQGVREGSQQSDSQNNQQSQTGQQPNQQTGQQANQLISYKVYPETISEYTDSYYIMVTYPRLVAEDNMDAALSFSNTAKQVAEQHVAKFKESLSEFADEQMAMMFIELSYEYYFPATSIISLLYSGSYYFGGAHPGSSFEVLTFNLETGQAVELADMFQPGVDYLQLLSDLSIAQLSANEYLDEADINSGAAPVAQNYKTVYLSEDSLKIVFGEYQVGPYAVGPQTVTIPYFAIQDVWTLF